MRGFEQYQPRPSAPHGSADPTEPTEPAPPEVQAIKDTIIRCEKLIPQIIHYDHGRIQSRTSDLADQYYVSESDREDGWAEADERLEEARRSNPLIPRENTVPLNMELSYNLADSQVKISVASGFTNADYPLWSVVVNTSAGKGVGQEDRILFQAHRRSKKEGAMLSIWTQHKFEKVVHIDVDLERITQLETILKHCLSQAIEHGEPQKTKEELQ